MKTTMQPLKSKTGQVATRGNVASWRCAVLLIFFVAVAGMERVLAGVGTATPPIPGFGGLPFLSAPQPYLPPPQFSVDAGAIKAFTILGFIQNASVSDANCPELPAAQWGGTAVINGVSILIPCNMIVQMPAATFTWSELFDATIIRTTRASPASLRLAERNQPRIGDFAYPSIEMQVVGNIVGGRHIGALVYISQQSLNSGAGYVSGFDHANGVIYLAASPGGAAQVRLQINDVNGRFSKGQTPDNRFNVDDENPTIRAITGYPMCIPRLDPATGGDDPLCPQRNRPLAAGGCRNFAAAGWRLPSGQDLPAPAAGQVYCSSFVMGDPQLALPQEPISTAQAPFEIGDYVTFSGTLLQGDGAGPQGSDTISVHTLTANVGIYTEPGTLPVYVAIGEFGVSPESPRVFNGVPQEAADRLVLDAFVTDVTSIADVYFVDIDPVTGAESQRWLTPGSMTGGFGSIADDGSYVDGGITTQFTGPVPGRVRIRANKAAQGILSSPSRYMRVVVRQLCDPTTINGLVASIDGAGGRVPCLQRATVANGLMSGQYMAPVGNYIFPENVVPGDAPVANDLWALGFLIVGEGPGSGALKPQPW